MGSESRASDKMAVYTDTITLADLTKAQFERACQFRDTVEAHWAQGSRSLEAMTSIGKRFGLGRSQTYKVVGRYRQTRDLLSFVPGKSSGGRGASRLADKVDALIEPAIDAALKMYTNGGATEVLSLLKSEIRVLKTRDPDTKLAVPCINTVRARMDLTPKADHVARRMGRKRASTLFDPVIGTMPAAFGLLDRIFIDYTIVDAAVYSRFNPEVAGRPWLGVALEQCSRSVLAFILSFEPPSATLTAKLLMRAVAPKDDWLLRTGVEFPWPMYGKPTRIHVDNGKEFDNRALKYGCGRNEIELEFREPGQPRMGGIIERCIGSMMNEIKLLPESTFDQHRQRSIDIQPFKRASMTIEDLERYFGTFIAGVYHRRPHSFHLGQGRVRASPYEVWCDAIMGTDSEIGIGMPPVVEDIWRYQVDFLPRTDRKVGREGVESKYAFYWHDAFRDILRTGEKRKFWIHPDPFDMGSIAFMMPDGEFLKCEAKDSRWNGIQMWEVEKVREIAKINAGNNEDVVLDAIEAMRKQTVEAKTKKGRARRAMDDERRVAIHKNAAPDRETSTTTAPAAYSVRPDENPFEPFSSEGWT